MRLPECLQRCLKAGRPPQLWRKSALMDDGLAHLDALICPSLSTRHEHSRRGIDVPMVHLPYFLPVDYTGAAPIDPPYHARPYVAAAGRLEKIKGFQDVIDVMRRLPEIDLRIAGSGGFENELRQQAADLKNVHFEDRIDSAQVAALSHGAPRIRGCSFAGL